MSPLAAAEWWCLLFAGLWGKRNLDMRLLEVVAEGDDDVVLAMGTGGVSEPALEYWVIPKAAAMEALKLLGGCSDNDGGCALDAVFIE